MADQGGLQLLPESRKKVEIKREGENKLLILGVAILILIIAAFVASNFYLTSLSNELAVLDSQYLDIENQRDDEAEENIMTINRQLSLISSLLDNHIFWSQGFEKFEKLTLPELRFKSLVGVSGGEKIDFKINTLNYTNIAKQVSAYLSDSAVLDVDINNTTVLPNGTVDADLSIKFDQVDFLNKQ